MPEQRIIRPTELRALGATDRESRRAVQGLSRLVAGSYGDLSGLASEEAYLLRARAILHARPSLVGSHVTAALVHGLPVARASLETVHVTRGPGLRGRPRSPSGYRIHTRAASRAEIVDRGGLLVTTALRTLLDLPQVTSLDWAVAAADAALHARLVEPDQFRDACLRVRGIRGAERIREVCPLSSRLAESPGETLLRLRMWRWGWRPQEQVALPWVAGRPRVDFLVEGRLVVEFDGAAKYALDGDVAAAHLREKTRNDALSEAGFEVIHIRWADLWDETALRQRLEAALRRARRRPTSS